MIYLTKIWLMAERLSHTYSIIKTAEFAKQKSEKIYRELYKRHCDLYILNESKADIYKNPLDELKKIDNYINDPDVSEPDKLKRKEFKQGFLFINKKRIESGIFYTFDQQLCERQFAEEMKQNEELYKNLPKEILNKIADIRVFALGYTTEEVKKLLKPYCAKLQRLCRETKNKAFANTDKAEASLSEKLNLNKYYETFLMDISEKNGDIYLNFDYGDILLIKKGKIIEGAGHKLYPFDIDAPNSGWSIIIAAELHRVNEYFELHFMVSNNNEFNQNDLWYLTLRGNNITQINA